MNEATKQAIEQFIQKILAGAEAAGNFTTEQTPLLVQEWLRWQIVDSAFWLVVGLVILAVSLLTWKRSWKISFDEDIPLIVANFTGVLLGSLMTVTNTFDLIKVLVAPRVVLLEKFADLVR